MAGIEAQIIEGGTGDILVLSAKLPEAEKMLVTAFYADALSRIDNLAVRERFAAALALRTA